MSSLLYISCGVRMAVAMVVVVVLVRSGSLVRCEARLLLRRVRHLI